MRYGQDFVRRSQGSHFENQLLTATSRRIEWRAMRRTTSGGHSSSIEMAHVNLPRPSDFDADSATSAFRGKVSLELIWTGSSGAGSEESLLVATHLSLVLPA